MAAITPDDIAHYLKECYDGQTVSIQTPKDCTFYDLLKKNGNGGGESYPLPVNTSSGQGIGSKFSTAQSSAGAGNGYKFSLTWGRNFMVYRVTDEAIETAHGGNSSFVDTVDHEMETIMETYGLDNSRQLWGNGGAPLGTRASASTNVITLTSLQDAYNFHEGMTVTASADDGSLTSHTLRVGSTTVSSVDREAGTVTLASAAAITDFANSDKLFRAGTFQGNPATTGVKLFMGIQGWMPSSAPSSTLFFGVDRTNDTRLSGTRLPSAIATGSNAERIRKAAAFAFQTAGAKPRHCFVSPMQWEVLSIYLQQKGMSQIRVGNYTGTMGYDAMEMVTPNGRLAILSDRHCPETGAFLLNMDKLEFISVNGEHIKPLDRGGSAMLHVSDDAAWERRWMTLGNLANRDPGQHARCSLTAVS